MTNQEVRIGNNAHAEREGRAGAVGKVLGGARSQAPAVGDLRTADGAGGAIIIITRGDGRGAEVTAVEGQPRESAGSITHLHHAILAVVGGEGGTVRDRPATDEIVGQVGRAQRTGSRIRGRVGADLDLGRRDDARDRGSGGDVRTADGEADGETGGARYRDDAVRIRGTNGREVVVCRAGGAVDLLEEHSRVGREGLVAEGIGTAGVIGGPTVDADDLTGVRGEHEVADVETHGAAHIDVGQHVDGVATGARGERVDADGDVGGTRAVDAEFAADQGDRHRRIEAGRILDGVEAVVIEA